MQKRREDGEGGKTNFDLRFYSFLPFFSAMALKALDQRMAGGPSPSTNGPTTSSSAGRQHQATPHSRSNSVIDPKSSEGGEDPAR